MGNEERKMMELETGYFFISDISGCSQFLSQSESDDAQEILDVLF